MMWNTVHDEMLEHFSPDSYIPFYSRIYFDYNLQEANDVEYCTRRNVMQRNIGLDPFIGTKKGTVERGTEWEEVALR